MPLSNVLPADPRLVNLGLAIDQLVAALTPNGAPFYWWPVQSRRHAVAGRRPHTPTGSAGRTLCGHDLVLPADDKYTWLWPSCPDCWDAAKALRR